MTLHAVGDEIALADLVTVEAVRVLRPALYDMLVQLSDSIFAASAGAQVNGGPGSNADERPIRKLRELEPVLAENICRWLFPAARRYIDNYTPHVL